MLWCAGNNFFWKDQWRCFLPSCIMHTDPGRGFCFTLKHRFWNQAIWHSSGYYSGECLLKISFKFKSLIVFVLLSIEVKRGSSNLSPSGSWIEAWFQNKLLCYSLPFAYCTTNNLDSTDALLQIRSTMLCRQTSCKHPKYKLLVSFACSISAL